MNRFLALLGTAATTAALGLSAGAATPSVASSPALFHQPRIAVGKTVIHKTTGIRQAGWSSSNWSGYAKTGTFTKATAQWRVPSVSATRGSSYSSAWVGIDGFNNSSLIQTGTESDYYSGAAHYNAWWEILPAAETPISSITVRPGDVMTASITKGSGSTWTITIKDTTTGKSYTTSKSYSGPGTSVEWIEEAPEVNGRIATLAHYSSPDTFDPNTDNGVNPALTSSESGAMVQNGVQVSTPSTPDSDTDGFNMAYGSTAPAPPAS